MFVNTHYESGTYKYFATTNILALIILEHYSHCRYERCSKEISCPSHTAGVWVDLALNPDPNLNNSNPSLFPLRNNNSIICIEWLIQLFYITNLFRLIENFCEVIRMFSSKHCVVLQLYHLMFLKEACPIRNLYILKGLLFPPAYVTTSRYYLNIISSNKINFPSQVELVIGSSDSNLQISTYYAVFELLIYVSISSIIGYIYTF